MNTIQQDRPLRVKILSLLLDNKWLAIYGNTVILPEFFEEDAEKEITKAILLYYEAYRCAPSDPDDVIALLPKKLLSDERQKKDCSELVYEIFDDDFDTKLASDIVIQFAKEQAVKNAILDGVAYIQRGDLQTPYAMIGEAMKVGENLVTAGLDVVDDVEKWLYEYWFDKVRTPWPHINYVLNGGVGSDELGVILAPTNVGKSLALVDIGYAAAGIGSGKNVIHFTHEMSIEKTAKRYAARMLFKFLKRGDDIIQYEEEFLIAAKKLMPGNIRIIGGASKMKFSELRGHVIRLVAEGFDPGLIIDDYADLIVPDRYSEQHRFDLSNIYKNLRSLSGEFSIPIWTASQAGRDSMTKEIVTLDTISEDIGKAMIADVIIAVCQTKDELAADKCRLFLAKSRDSSKKVSMWDAKFYPEQQAIITTGVTRKKEQKDV
jgi:replicative DNA helicase